MKSARVYGIFDKDKVDNVSVIKGEAVNDIFYRTIDGYRNLLVCFTAKIQGRHMYYMASIQNNFLQTKLDEQISLAKTMFQ